MFSSASAISCAACRAMATISGLAPSTCEVTASEPTIRPVIGCLTGAPAQASSASAALKCSAPRTNTTPRASMGVPSPLVPKDCSEKSKPSTALARSMVRSSCASTIRRQTMRPASSARKRVIRESARFVCHWSRIRPAARRMTLSGSTSPRICGPASGSMCDETERRQLCSISLATSAGGMAARSRPSAINRSRAPRTSSS